MYNTCITLLALTGNSVDHSSSGGGEYGLPDRTTIRMSPKKEHGVPLGLSVDLPGVPKVSVNLCFREMCLTTRFISNSVPGLCMYNMQSMRCMMRHPRICSRAVHVNRRPARLSCVLHICCLSALSSLSAGSSGLLRWAFPCKDNCKRCPQQS